MRYRFSSPPSSSRPPSPHQDPGRIALLQGRTGVDPEPGSLLATPARLAVSGLPLADALSRLSERSRVRIAFSPTLLPARHLVDCPCTGLSTAGALDRLLEGTGLGYVELGSQVVVVPGAEPGIPGCGRGHSRAGSHRGNPHGCRARQREPGTGRLRPGHGDAARAARQRRRRGSRTGSARSWCRRFRIRCPCGSTRARSVTPGPVPTPCCRPARCARCSIPRRSASKVSTWSAANVPETRSPRPATASSSIPSFFGASRRCSKRTWAARPRSLPPRRRPPTSPRSPTSGAAPATAHPCCSTACGSSTPFT